MLTGDVHNNLAISSLLTLLALIMVIGVSFEEQQLSQAIASSFLLFFQVSVLSRCP